MSDTTENVMTVPDYDSHKDLIVKWLQILLVCQIASLFATVLGAFAAIGNVAGLISRIISIAIIVSLFSLSPVNKRYRKAALFYGISVGGGILSSLLNISLLGMVFSICSIIASYQELNAHCEITASKDAKLSKRWHSLFYLTLVIGLLSSFLASAGVVIAALANMDPDATVSVALIVIALASAVPLLLHILYLKQTLALYKE